MNPLEIPIVVVSWDANDDLWKPFFELFFTNWPGCRRLDGEALGCVGGIRRAFPTPERSFQRTPRSRAGS